MRCSEWLKKSAPVALLVSVVLLAQETPTISSNVKVVNVLATVRDNKGRIVNTLTKDDFVLEENGTPQTIKYFARETDASLSLGLLVDTSRSVANELGSEKKASATFATNVLREGKDSAFLIHFDREVELLRDLTSSRDKFVRALDLLEQSEPDSQRGNNGGGGYPGGGGGYPGGGGGGYPGSGGGGSRHQHGGGGTLLYDSVYLASDEVLSKQQGRKAIILLTDGVDHGSKMSLEKAIESAQRSNTIVYGIYFEGEEGQRFGDHDRDNGGGHHGGGGGGWPGGGGGWPGGGGGGGGRQRQPRDEEPKVDGKKILERLSQETGGQMFHVSRKEPIDKIYTEIQEDLRNQYSLGYSPDKNSEGDDEYRHIKVTTKQKELKVQSRDGYYPAQPLKEEAGTR